MCLTVEGILARLAHYQVSPVSAKQDVRTVATIDAIRAATPIDRVDTLEAKDVVLDLQISFHEPKAKALWKASMSQHLPALTELP